MKIQTVKMQKEAEKKVKLQQSDGLIASVALLQVMGAKKKKSACNC